MYNIRSVSQMVGIAPVTIRAWETRYHVIVPTRSKGGHRLYSQQDIEDLLWLKKQVDEVGMSISQAASILKKNKLQRQPVLARDKAVPVTEEFAVREELLQQLHEMNAEKTHAIIDRAFQIFSFDYVVHRILTPLMVEVGEKWYRKEIHVAQEHFMSQIVMQRCLQFSRLFPVNPQLPKTMAICPEGEHHQIGLVLFSLFLRRHGVDVLFLGANTPLEGLAELIDELGVERIVLSGTMIEVIPETNRVIEQLALGNRHLKFFAGGKVTESPLLDPRYVRVGAYEKEWETIYDKFWNRMRSHGMDTGRGMRYPTGG